MREDRCLPSFHVRGITWNYESDTDALQVCSLRLELTLYLTNIRYDDKLHNIHFVHEFDRFIG